MFIQGGSLASPKPGRADIPWLPPERALSADPSQADTFLEVPPFTGEFKTSQGSSKQTFFLKDEDY